MPEDTYAVASLDSWWGDAYITSSFREAAELSRDRRRFGIVIMSPHPHSPGDDEKEAQMTIHLVYDGDVEGTALHRVTMGPISMDRRWSNAAHDTS